MKTRSRIAFCCVALAAACGGDPPGFDTPESAIHDGAADLYYVSNIVGAPAAKDGNGYIARLWPAGRMERRWIQGGRNGVTLHAPKGLAIAGDVLWVADIDVLRRFHRVTGAPLGEVAIPGASFLNDVGAAPDGTIYCTDTGVDANFAPTGTDAIWKLEPGKEPKVLARGAELGQPNGLVALPTGVYVVSWRDGTFYQIDVQGRRTDLGKAPQAQLDGLVRLPASGDKAAAWIATSWAGACAYRFDQQGNCTEIRHRMEQPADLGFDGKRGILLVPLFGSNRLELLKP